MAERLENSANLLSGRLTPEVAYHERRILRGTKQKKHTSPSFTMKLRSHDSSIPRPSDSSNMRPAHRGSETGAHDSAKVAVIKSDSVSRREAQDTVLPREQPTRAITQDTRRPSDSSNMQLTRRGSEIGGHDSANTAAIKAEGLSRREAQNTVLPQEQPIRAFTQGILSGGTGNTYITNTQIVNGGPGVHSHNPKTQVPSESGHSGTENQARRSLMRVVVYFWWCVTWLWYLLLMLLNNPVKTSTCSILVVFLWLKPCNYMPAACSLACRIPFVPAALFCTPPQTSPPTSDATFTLYDEWPPASLALRPADQFGIVYRAIRGHHDNLTYHRNIPGVEAIDSEILHLAWLINRTQHLQDEYASLSYTIWTRVNDQLAPIATAFKYAQLAFEDKSWYAWSLSVIASLSEALGYGADYRMTEYRKTLMEKLSDIQMHLQKEILPIGRELVQANHDIETQFDKINELSRHSDELLQHTFDRQFSWSGYFWAGFSTTPALRTLEDMDALRWVMRHTRQSALELWGLGLTHWYDVHAIRQTTEHLDARQFTVLSHDAFIRQVQEWAAFANDQWKVAKAQAFKLRPNNPIITARVKV